MFSPGGSRFSTILNKSHRSRSVPSIQCSICKQNHGRIRTSESMHYTPRVTFKEPNSSNSVRGSLPDLRNECTCMHRRYACGRPSLLRLHAYSSGSTESLLDEADDFLHKSVDGMSNFKVDRKATEVNRRRSENDIKRGDINYKNNCNDKMTKYRIDFRFQSIETVIAIFAKISEMSKIRTFGQSHCEIGTSCDR